MQKTEDGNTGAALMIPSYSDVSLHKDRRFSIKNTLETDAGVKGSMKFLIDKGAELCLCKYSSIKKGN
jgi:hypothetical protein